MSGILKLLGNLLIVCKTAQRIFSVCLCVWCMYVMCVFVSVCAKTQNCVHSLLMLPKCLIPLSSDEGGVLGNGVYAVYGSE